MGWRRTELEDFAAARGESRGAVGQHIEFAVVVLPKATDAAEEFLIVGDANRFDLPAGGGRVISGRTSRPEEAALRGALGAGPIAIDIMPDEFRQRFATVDIAAGDADAEGLGVVFEAAGILVHGDRVNQGFAAEAGLGQGSGSLLGMFPIEAFEALAQGPAVVAAFSDDIDLLPTHLADIGDIQGVVAAAIEA